MDVRLQAKLLRVLQEREIDRLGGTAPVPVNVRIIATSNRDLPAEIARGQFREDLYFRLNVVGLRIPPLCERRGDIAGLAEHFARRYAELNGLPERRIAPAALARLRAHGWRGNVRELENTLHRAVLLADGELIDNAAIELAGEITGPPSASPSASSPATAKHDAATFIGRRMDDVERDVIIGTLTHTLGNRTHAAVILGISIRALRNKLRDYAASGVAVPPPATPTAMPGTPSVAYVGV
jgi:two-component system response regulator FlrC